ncbi:YjbF family lipoprotein [Vibrio natriegens]|uniref:Regulator n=1 Tax=Vibrio natriegens NBRC 15636 = ATCC 14048 = DSM 759 TaxID=1219067 RepID=A0AAN0Y017_VIBNA|nr:YjbF family lipoprotein [Vibrio natriegens]ALR16719.1 regulator [Vibrio natriegens NBRC 15636 = ATCC 14048 = DSM 759]ANQ11415.1 regulator [Vibrio natriegens NBRC 15636 = ATCC 14048 = DSM 759]EPM38979.1 regulator [Vibrio natriegens NBRC 15636 = ATCC 14048 = DSM 759]MDX6025744.1 YjbF family lipoprotein [Vibrio natriegens NBRC 15636 = ATCC 14048 = DSM 759]UUI11863.1 YjbF family lipoprotein [Vibrio natriegens]
MNIFRAKNWKRLLLILPAVSLMFGCTQKFKDVSATVQEAYGNYIDVELTHQQIEAIPYASAYLKIGNQKQIFVVLAFAEQNPLTGKTQLKWVSSDKAMVVTENGHIVKTLNLQNNNIAGVYGQVPAYSTLDIQYLLSYDWEEQYRYGFPAHITRTYQGKEVVTTPLSSTSADVYRESVEFPSLSETVENFYWVNSHGQVVKTRQHLGPNMLPIELTILKGYSK